MDSMQKSLRLLTHYRHDVMNDVQLLKGYLQLGKTDRLVDVIQKMVEESGRYNRMSSLPTLLSYTMLEVNTLHPFICLDVEKREWIEGEDVSAWVGAIKELNNQLAFLANDLMAPLQIKIDFLSFPSSLGVGFSISGESVTVEYIEKWIRLFQKQGWQLADQEQNQDEMTIRFTL